MHERTAIDDLMIEDSSKAAPFRRFYLHLLFSRSLRCENKLNTCKQVNLSEIRSLLSVNSQILIVEYYEKYTMSVAVNKIEVKAFSRFPVS
jgi:hypothetical protein